LKKTVVLAYSGGQRSAAGVGWLVERHSADVVTMTLDLGVGRASARYLNGPQRSREPWRTWHQNKLVA